MNIYSGQTGFTIIELMIVVVIAGVIATFALPSMDFALSNSRVRTAASDVHISLLLARSEAIKRNSNITVERNTSWANGWDVKSGTTVIKTQDALGDVTTNCYTDVTGTTPCGATVTFTRSGRPSTYLEYRLYDSGNSNIPTRCVKVSLSGRPGITVDDDTDPTNGCG